MRIRFAVPTLSVQELSLDLTPRDQARSMTEINADVRIKRRR
jgi:hypothetical protein